MKNNPLTDLVDRLRSALQSAEVQGISDAELLQRWLQQRDESAFELLIWRHGRLVLSVCSRMLPEPTDREDAFQATFLVLVRRARHLVKGQALAAWLHTVAVRVAQRVRNRRRPLLVQDEHLRQVPGRAEPESQEDLRAVLDAEVARLPDSYREPFVLCHLNGHTNEEAARLLNRPVGTILSRLARARERLRQRLVRRGIYPTALLTVPCPMEPVTGSLVVSTLQLGLAWQGGLLAGSVAAAPVVVLAEGVLNGMFLAKIKVVATLVLAVSLLSVGGVTGYQGLEPGQDPTAAPSAKKEVVPALAGQPKELPRQKPLEKREERQKEEQRKRHEMEFQSAISSLEAAQAELQQAQTKVEMLTALIAQLKRRLGDPGPAIHPDRSPDKALPKRPSVAKPSETNEVELARRRQQLEWEFLIRKKRIQLEYATEELDAANVKTQLAEKRQAAGQLPWNEFIEIKAAQRKAALAREMAQLELEQVKAQSRLQPSPVSPAPREDHHTHRLEERIEKLEVEMKKLLDRLEQSAQPRRKKE